MSRIGKKPIPIPKGVTVKIEGNTVLVQGRRASWTPLCRPASKLSRRTEHGRHPRERFAGGCARAGARPGQQRRRGVTKGWTRELEIVGIGYRAEMKGKNMVVFSLGYSHPIEYPLPTGVEATVDPKQTKIALTGIDRQKVGQVAAEMRSLRPPDPYKNKGVRYAGERLKKKVGKTGAK
jgi:large subunit ribosomal protein L6